MGFNWSVLVIFALVTLGLAAGQFPMVYPGRTTAAYALAGLIAGMLFFLSLLAHEIAHAVVARHNGVEVDGITLWMLGGVARLQGEPATPSAELRIAGVGPAVSLALAAGFALIGVGLRAIGSAGLPTGVCMWLATINLVLAVFNLIPAAPLDGGRLLRALLWRLRGDRVGAAVTASRAGRRFGWLLVALGLVQFVMADPGGLWLMLLGWFITTAATAEEQQAEVTGALAGVRVADVMSPDPVTVPAEITVARFLDAYVFAHRHSTFPVTDDGRLTGMVTLQRVKRIPVGRRAATPVGQVACPLADVPVARSDDALSDLLPRMTTATDGRALVVDGDRLVGLVSPSDVVRRLEIAALRPRRPEHT
ncbi:MAG TPA: site-2 protease family protein [Euzebyales bacterium]|nr:site-2 protease family protein [Euzebyales bacterium]